MEVAVGACFFAEGNVYINAGHSYKDTANEMSIAYIYHPFINLIT